MISLRSLREKLATSKLWLAIASDLWLGLRGSLRCNVLNSKTKRCIENRKNVAERPWISQRSVQLSKGFSLACFKALRPRCQTQIDTFSRNESLQAWQARACHKKPHESSHVGSRHLSVELFTVSPQNLDFSRGGKPWKTNREKAHR